MDSTVMEGEPHRSQHHGTMIICYTVFNYVCLQSFFDNIHNAHHRIGIEGKRWKDNILKTVEKE